MFKSRYTFLLIVIFLYLLPILLLVNYGKLYMPPQKSWNLFVFGLFCSSVGTLLIFWILCRLSEKEENQTIEAAKSVSTESLEQTNEINITQAKAFEEMQSQYVVSQEQLTRVQTELDHKKEELERFQHEFQVLNEQLEEVNIQHRKAKELAHSDLEQLKKLLADSQRTISDQREDLDKKLQQIVQLESKVSDLTYEIKTLIQLAEIENQSMPIYSSQPMESSVQGHSSYVDMSDEENSCLPEKQVRNENQALVQLKRCIDIAQKITGANHYNNSNSRFKDLAIDNYALDLRRLFDNLRMENASTIIFYSQKENKILFINNQLKNLLGWSPDKFIQSFQDIVEPSRDTWKHGIASLAIKNDVHLQLKMKSKTGSQLDVNALLGIIPTGIFRHHIIGVLYS